MTKPKQQTGRKVSCQNREIITEALIRFGLVLCVLFIYLLLPSVITLFFDAGEYGEMIATGVRLFMVFFAFLLIWLTSKTHFVTHVIKGQRRAWIYAIWPLLGQIIIYIMIVIFHGRYSIVSFQRVVELMIIVIAEEVIFRIFIIRMLSPVLETRFVVFYSALFFALAHSINYLTTDMTAVFVFIQMILAWFIGELFAWGYTMSRNILPFVITHFLINITAESFIFSSTPVCIMITAAEAVWIGIGATVMLSSVRKKKIPEIM